MEKIVNEVLEKIHTLPCKEGPELIALDGRCAAGKTSLAKGLQKRIHCTVFHMDDFFLRPEQRSRERLNTPGGNVDYERFYEEVMAPLKNGASEITYRPYDCHEQQLLKSISIKPSQIVLIEGSYSCHPKLWDFYSLRIFLTVNPDEQLRRIVQRSGQDSIGQFQERWIPLEEQYFTAYQIKERCDLCFQT